MKRVIKAASLFDHIEESPSTVSLFGDCGGSVMITGEVSTSTTIPDCILIETEVGTIYIDADENITVSEAESS